MKSVYFLTPIAFLPGRIRRRNLRRSRLVSENYRMATIAVLGTPPRRARYRPPTYKDVDGDGVPEDVLSWVRAILQLLVFNSEGKS